MEDGPDRTDESEPRPGYDGSVDLMLFAAVLVAGWLVVVFG